MLSQIFESVIPSSLTPGSFAVCTLVSLLLGAVIALCYMKTGTRYTGSFVTTLAMLTTVVQIVIMMVNGNLGAGVAVAGAFSLVRFRSIPGTAREIGFIFVALACGLATGMGYVAFAVVFALIMCIISVIYKVVGFGERNAAGKKTLTVVVPENLDYTDIFNDIFETYLSFSDLISVKTTNMGSLFKLKYEIRLKDPKTEKQFIDALRCRNGNLEIICARDIYSQAIL
ncbi:MAG: DUF4956 domain-containing protein [Oscillospiraceae bacterium]|nr:DUF4956 domain-containing protein [Oscillospiraceae bacterium]